MDIDIKQIKELAKRFTPEQIEGCITQQLETGENICLRNESAEKIINELSKAEFIRDLINKGISLAEALRELARRMRLVQRGFKGECNEYDRADLLNSNEKKLAYLFLSEYAASLPDIQDELLADNWAFDELERLGFLKK